ncbi:MAG: S-layer homology domain-containing protein [Patescibacteria group bacterium]
MNAFRKVLSVFALTSLIAATTAVQASSDKSAANFLAAKDAVAAITFMLPSSLKQRLSQLLDTILVESETQAPSQNLFIKKIREGAPIHLGVGKDAQSLVLLVPATDAEWQVVIEGGAVQETHNGTDIYLDSYNTPVAWSDGFMLVSESAESITAALDASSGSVASLAGDANWQEVSADMLDNPFFSTYFSLASLGDLIKQSLGSNVTPANTDDLLKILEKGGVSARETSDGYEFKMSMYGDKDYMTANNLSYNMSGTYSPRLHTKMPNNQVIFYTSAYNTKAESEMSDKLVKDITGQETAFPPIDFSDSLGIDVTLDMNEDIYGMLTKEVVFAMQRNPNNVVPFVTFMADVSDTRQKALSFVSKMEQVLDAVMEQNTPGVFKKSTKTIGGSEMLLYTIDPTKEENFDGPPMKPFPLLIGVTSDNILLITSDPGKGAGFFSSEGLPAFTGDNIAGFAYLNMRNIWDALDGFIAWAEEVGGGIHGPPLDFYQGYFTMLETAYGFSDALFLSEAETAEAHVTVSIHTDNQKHQTFEEFSSVMKSRDTDGDGVSDYDQRFRYGLSVMSYDSDDDGVFDSAEIRAGTNPNGEGQLFSDVAQDEWYTEDVGDLYVRGTVKGYEDQTFRPGAQVSRREFTTMVVRAFNTDLEKTFGLKVSLSGTPEISPFSDLSPNDWAYESIITAQRLGFVNGYSDGTFKPNDPISRAEAVAILNRASSVLQKNQLGAIVIEDQTDPSQCEFSDSSDAWYTDSVNNACALGVTKGKKPGEFRPLDKVTRAESAALIKRALDVEFAYGDY